MKYGLLGEKLSHSFSPRIHEMLGNKEYSLFALPEEKLDSFLREGDFKGINVTIPYKQKVIPYLSSISDRARRIGAVNTVVRREDGSLSGFNTDYAGLKFMLTENGIDPAGKKVLILGSGGTSLTALAVVSDMGARQVVRVSRHGEDNYENLDRHHDSEIILNTTPVGMYPGNGRALIDLSDFPRAEAVADVIYNPFYTRLLLDARDRGLKHANGLIMLVAQAKAASDIFFGGEEGEFTDSDRALIRDIHGRLYRELCNISLIGMPSSGKSSVGEALAKALGKEFTDLDEEIEKRVGKSIPEIFESEGEQGFRDIESSAAEEIGAERGKVIATGGGAVLRRENYYALKQNSIMILLKRDIEKLSLDGRPLSKSREALREMYDERNPVYEARADITVFNNGELEDTLKAVKEELEKYEAFGH